ncbi:transcriptional regulator GcvA [Paraburkholderia sediminicola]|uniref:transcriptional regulator GcvA n=1 Tax=Paraburkholderia sediminicola TaxID=458836 RepID=UPI0038BB5792
MSKSLPPLNPLRVFEAVARLGNLTKAAEELHVSQSAVSRQITTLEGYLDVRLFTREARGVVLTKQGRFYRDEVSPAFARIAAATQRLRSSGSSIPLKVSAYTTFAAKWLLPNLSKFEQAHPRIEIRLTSSVQPVNFDKDDVNIAIQFGDGKRTDVTSIRLFDDLIEPVCSPSIMASDRPLLTPPDLVHHKLIHSRFRTADWPDWQRANGVETLRFKQGPNMPSSLLAYEAAVGGLGVAIGQTHLLKQELASGQLIRPFDLPLRRPLGYYALLPRNSDQAEARVFLEWLKDEMKLQGLD